MLSRKGSSDHQGFCTLCKGLLSYTYLVTLCPALALQVVQSLHSCFLYDTVSFLDEARFHRLLPMLVSQLAVQPAAAVSAVLAAQPAHTAASSADSADSGDLFGQAVVAALVQMAVTANNDALWKSLNHQVGAVTT